MKALVESTSVFILLLCMACAPAEAPPAFPLTLNLEVSGQGRVLSSDQRIDCADPQQSGVGNDCSAVYQSDDDVLFYAEPGPGYVLVDWGAACHKALCSLQDFQPADSLQLSVQFSKRNATARAPASYTYNAFGQRSSKTVDAVTTLYVYDINGRLLAELDEAGNTLVEHVYANGEPLAQIHGSGSEARTYYVHTDHLGTPLMLSDDSRQVVWSRVAAPFGEAMVELGDVAQNLRFPGQYYDGESGLVYNYYRDYDPGLGRYIQSDPIGLSGGMNTYGYAYQGPIVYIDPDGQLALQLINAGVGAALGGYSAYQNGGSTGDIIGGAIIGAAGNLISGRATIKAIIAASTNIASQVTDPCFNGIDYSQVVAAGALGAYGLGSRLPQPNLMSNKSVAVHAAVTQTINTMIVNSF